MSPMPSNSTQDLIRKRQAPLRAIYREEPGRAWVVDHAGSAEASLDDPLHARVRFGTRSCAEFDYGVHHAVGGLHDAPVPGDLLCAALASCQESTLRLIANLCGVQLAELAVDVEASADVRGTLAMDPAVPVGFQQIRMKVRLRAAPGTDPQRVQATLQAAERSCVVLQTLRGGVPVSLDLDGDLQTSISGSARRTA